MNITLRSVWTTFRMSISVGLKIEALKADFPDAVEQLTRFIEFIGSSPRGVIR